MASAEIKVSIESVIQKEIAAAIQEIHDKYGIIVDEIGFDWIATADGKAYITCCKTISRCNI